MIKYEAEIKMSLFQITVGLLVICITVIFISLNGFVQPADASTTNTPLEDPWLIITTTPLGYPGDHEYKAYLQVVIRDKNDKLTSVTESVNTWMVPTFFPNDEPAPLWINTVFYNTLQENYQTAIINDIKYEKVEYYNTYEINRAVNLADSYLWLCANVQVYGEICMKSFYARSPMVLLEDGDILTEKWTILRNISQ